MATTAKQTKQDPDAEVKAGRMRQFEETMDWMRDNGARQVARFKTGGKGDEMALYQFAGTTVIVQTYADGHGWEFYAPITGEMTWEGTKAALQRMLTGN